MKKRMRNFLCAGACLLSLSAPVGVAAAEEAPAAAPVQEPVPAAYATPRATLRTFLTAVSEAGRGKTVRIRDAVRALDLSGLPKNIGAQKDQELALVLKDVIDRVRFIRYEEIPNDPKGPPWVLWEEPGLGRIVVARGTDGWWRFTDETVAHIDDLHRALEARKIVEGAERAPSFLSPAMWLRGKMPPGLRNVGFLFEHWQWLGLFAVVLVGFLLDRIFRSVLLGLLVRVLQRRKVSVERVGMVQALRPFGLLVTALFWRLGLSWLGLPAKTLAVFHVATDALAAFALVWGIYRVIDLVSAEAQSRAAKTDTKVDDLLIPLIRKTSKVVVAAFGVVFIADAAQVPISSLLAGLGLAGMAVALAAQDTVKNVFGSLTVLLDQPFVVGDWVSMEGVEGTVEELGFRSTRVRTYYDSLVTVPNAKLLTANVDNYGKRQRRAWKTMLTLSYDTSPEAIEAFCAGVRELIARFPNTQKDGVQVFLNGFGASSLDVHLFLFFDTTSRMVELQSRHDLMLQIMRLAAALGVDFAFPTQTLHLRKEEAPVRPVEIQGSAAEVREKGQRLAAEIAAAAAEKEPPTV